MDLRDNRVMSQLLKCLQSTYSLNYTDISITKLYIRWYYTDGRNIGIKIICYLKWG